jgi:2-methylisocitrate lyase-like PEP mutase family enzyme
MTTPPDRLRALLAQPGLITMPAVWDGLSATLAAGAGFETAFLSGSCVAAARLGGPDLDLVSFAEMFDNFMQARNAAPQTLILADADHGYGNAMNVKRTVSQYGRAGAAAILIEDKVTPRPLTGSGKPCLPRDEARMKMRAAIEAAKESGILILARTDCRPLLGIDEALARIEMFADDGADMLFLDTPMDDDECLRGIAAAKGKPCFAVLSPGGKGRVPTHSEAEAMGYRIGAYPTNQIGPAITSQQAALAALKTGNPHGPGAPGFDEMIQTLGYAAYDQDAARFLV